MLKTWKSTVNTLFLPPPLLQYIFSELIRGITSSNFLNYTPWTDIDQATALLRVGVVTVSVHAVSNHIQQLGTTLYQLQDKRERLTYIEAAYFEARFKINLVACSLVNTSADLRHVTTHLYQEPAPELHFDWVIFTDI